MIKICPVSSVVTISDHGAINASLITTKERDKMFV